MKYAIALLLLCCFSISAMAQCTVAPGIRNAPALQQVVANSADVALVAAYNGNQCDITQTWHPGGDIPPGLINAKHITVRNQQNATTCHVFDYPQPGGHNYPTTCR